MTTYTTTTLPSPSHHHHHKHHHSQPPSPPPVHYHHYHIPIVIITSPTSSPSLPLLPPPQPSLVLLILLLWNALRGYEFNDYWDVYIFIYFIIYLSPSKTNKPSYYLRIILMNVGFGTQNILFKFLVIDWIPSYLSVLLSDKLWSWPQNHIKVQNSSSGTVCQGRQGLECHIWKCRKIQVNLKIFHVTNYPLKCITSPFSNASVLWESTLYCTYTELKKLSESLQDPISGFFSLWCSLISYYTFCHSALFNYYNFILE